VNTLKITISRLSQDILTLPSSRNPWTGGPEKKFILVKTMMNIFTHIDKNSNWVYIIHININSVNIYYDG